MFGTLKRISATIALSVLVSGGAAQAAHVTIDEAGMDGVFSQASFGNRPIDIRIGAITEIVAPDLLDITTDAEIGQLFGLHPSAQNVSNFYFVDTVDSCGGFNVNIVGCGELPGNDFVVESAFADSAFGTELLAHELGHNLNLPHVFAGPNNLMNTSLNGSTLLTEAQVDIIFNSPLVQADGNGGWFIQIDPILILAEPRMEPVPLPAAGLLLIGGVGALGLFRRKRKIA